MKNSNLAFVKIPQAQRAAPPPWSRPLCFQAKGLKNIVLLYWEWHLTELHGVLTWVNLNDKLGFLSPGPSFTIEQLDCCLVEGQKEESKFPSNPQWCHWPVGRLWPTPVNPCKSDASNLPFWLEYHTFNFRRHPLSEDPITDFNSPLLFSFFFKNMMTTDFLPAPPLISQGRLSDGSLISIQAEAACFFID